MSHIHTHARAREIIEAAIRDLMAMGLDNDGAASLLVIQGMIRIESQSKRLEMVESAKSCIAESTPKKTGPTIEFDEKGWPLDPK